MEYFKSQTPREQAMIIVMLVLIALFCIWQFIISPTMNMKADAERAQTAAMRDYAIVTSGAPKLSTASTYPVGNVFGRDAVVNVAEGNGLIISRLQSETGGALKIWLEDVSSAQVYGFIADLTQGYPAFVKSVQISKRDDGAVSAQVTLSPI